MAKVSDARMGELYQRVGASLRDAAEALLELSELTIGEPPRRGDLEYEDLQVRLRAMPDTAEWREHLEMAEVERFEMGKLYVAAPNSINGMVLSAVKGEIKSALGEIYGRPFTVRIRQP